MDNEMYLAALRVFRSVVRTGSFAGAARAMRLPKSTVSKRVRDLERTLEVRLIERTTRQMRVTPEGDLLAQRADRLLHEAEDIRRDIGLSNTEPAGHLRIAVPSFFGVHFMGRVGPRCRALYPDLTLEFVYLDRLPDLLEEGFDGAITYGPLSDSDLVVRTLVTGQFVPVAAPGLEGVSTVREPEDLSAVEAITLGPRRNRWTFSRAGETREVAVTGAMTFGSSLSCRDAAVAGGGVTMLPEFVAREEIAAGRLVRLLRDWVGMSRQIVFVYPSPQSVTARLRAFLDLLVDDLAAHGRGDGP
ncbi:LysR family transcriptional regulator [Tranquillimonas alkanivorans]|nr:LysR family transcriptional regulator [Tranquillimonas alkanivorans]